MAEDLKEKGGRFTKFEKGKAIGQKYILQCLVDLMDYNKFIIEAYEENHQKINSEESKWKLEAITMENKKLERMFRATVAQMNDADPV